MQRVGCAQFSSTFRSLPKRRKRPFAYLIFALLPKSAIEQECSAKLVQFSVPLSYVLLPLFRCVSLSNCVGVFPDRNLLRLGMLELYYLSHCTIGGSRLLLDILRY